MVAAKSQARALAGQFLSQFEDAGATVVETDILLPADALLDLYGEDMRARAFVTNDPLRGEAMLRPDFTVPIVQLHQASGNGSARYAYAGEVFRMQPDGSDRPVEYLQVGYESFGGSPAERDAEVFAIFHRVLAPFGLTPAIGDMGLLRAAVDGLSTSQARKAALYRHLWRPRRFRELLDRYRSKQARPVLAGQIDAPEIGLRTRDEVERRRRLLESDADLPPIPSAEADVLNEVLGLREDMGQVLPRLRDLSVDIPSLSAAADRFEARIKALSALGIEADALPFEASYGRTSMEYYDGFVFGFYLAGRPDLPPVATGGRYDALARAMGGAGATGAVGGVVRPGILTEIGRAG